MTVAINRAHIQPTLSDRTHMSVFHTTRTVLIADGMSLNLKPWEEVVSSFRVPGGIQVTIRDRRAAN